MGCGTFRSPADDSRARGVYRLDLRRVIDGTAWMEDEGVFLLVKVR